MFAVAELRLLRIDAAFARLGQQSNALAFAVTRSRFQAAERERLGFRVVLVFQSSASQRAERARVLRVDVERIAQQLSRPCELLRRQRLGLLHELVRHRAFGGGVESLHVRRR